MQKFIGLRNMFSKLLHYCSKQRSLSLPLLYECNQKTKGKKRSKLSKVKTHSTEQWQRRHLKTSETGKCAFKLLKKELYGMRRLSN